MKLVYIESEDMIINLDTVTSIHVSDNTCRIYFVDGTDIEISDIGEALFDRLANLAEIKITADTLR